MKQLVLIAHNIRSAHNVGSLLRTAEGLGVYKVFLTGYTPYPLHPKDTRMAHEAAKLDRQIHKTALGAEQTLKWEFNPDIHSVLQLLKSESYIICALEQSKHAIDLQSYHPGQKTALLIGNEVSGLEPALLDQSDNILEIPMAGKKESFNVAQAAAMALYHLRFHQ